MLRPIITSLIFLSCLPWSVSAVEINGKVGFSALLFQHSPQYQQQHNQQASLLAEVEFYQGWNNDLDSLLFKPYARIDQQDSERSHFDIRELMWLHVNEEDNWELRTGIGKVFWGVNETNHLVDIINQDDQVDDIGGDPKLGQAMINLSLIKDWGVLDFFILPGFRERTFPGEEGRLGGPLAIDTKHAEFESSAGKKHTDIAVRWSHTIDAYDMGIYYFQGTNRDPRFLPHQNTQGQISLIPYYDQINQFGLDFQATLEEWLWKLELIHRQDQFDTFVAASGGFEYTLIGIMESAIDLGVIMEYSWDQRDDPLLSQFQNDIMLGARLTFNDAQSTDFLAGIVQDMDYDKLRSFQIEASRRLGKDWKLSIELRLFSDHLLNPISEDDHVQLTLEKYF
ncbi:MAG: hypothetical protein QM479_10505 [Pseudomonadota bacterium]